MSIGGSDARTRNELLGYTYEVGHSDRRSGDRLDDILSDVHRLVHGRMIDRNGRKKQAESVINILI